MTTFTLIATLANAFFAGINLATLIANVRISRDVVAFMKALGK